MKHTVTTTLFEASFMKRAIRNRKQSRFTLVELLVSMGILVVILGFILQFFVSSQKVWSSMSQRNRTYSDARVAMDIMTTMLQNTFYSEGGIPFRINQDSAGKHKIYFATRTMQNLPGEALKYVSFQRNSDSGKEAQLMVSVFCDKENDFGNYFPPYGLGSISNLGDARSGVVAKLNSNLNNDSYGSVLIKRVISFEVKPYEIQTSGSGIKPVTDSTYDEIPFMVELKLKLLSPEKEKEWLNVWKDKPETDSGRKDFLNENSYTFSRTVFLGEQSRLNIK